MTGMSKAAYDWGFDDGKKGLQFMPDDLNSSEERLLRLFREYYRRGFLAGSKSL